MLARFERLMEQAVEGSLRRVFPTSLQPVQLAKAAARSMEQAQVVGVHGSEVPNQYDLRVASSDIARFRDYSSTLEQEVSRYLRDYARDRGLRPVAAIRVALIDDPHVRPGSVRAHARFVDLPATVQTEVDAALEGTRRLRLGDLAAARTGLSEAGTHIWWLTDELGLRFELESSLALVRLGRALDNDVVIKSQRVSRYHAQLRCIEGAWLVYDLDSTNGTWVEDRRVWPGRPQALEHGASLKLGDHAIDVRAEAPVHGPA